MIYKLLPFSDIWNDGVFVMPVSIVDSYIKIASSNQLKTLLIIMKNNGKVDVDMITKTLSLDESLVVEILEFWFNEGILSKDDEIVETKVNVTEEPKKVKINAPKTLTPRDILSISQSDDSVKLLLNEAQKIFARPISHSEQESLVNMVLYYGLKTEVILMILEYCKAQKSNGKTAGMSVAISLAKEWSNEGIDNIIDAEQKIKDIEYSDKLWSQVVALTGVKHKNPTKKQREMVAYWFDNYDISMISLAVDIMKESIPEPKLQYVNSIIKKWVKNGIKTPEDIEKDQSNFEENLNKSNKKSNDNLKTPATYDIDQIMKDAMDIPKF